MTAAIIALALVVAGLSAALVALAYRLLASLRSERASLGAETIAIRERDAANARAAHEQAERLKAEVDAARLVTQITATQRAFNVARKELTRRVHAQILGSPGDAAAVVDDLLSQAMPGLPVPAGDHGAADRRAVPPVKPTGADAISTLK